MISRLLNCSRLVSSACWHAPNIRVACKHQTSMSRFLSTADSRKYSLPANLTEVVEVTDLSLEVDLTNRKADESSPTQLEYSMPSFRASAAVKIPSDTLSENTRWELGWIQACRKHYHCQVYRTIAKDLTACGVQLQPQLKLGDYKMVNHYNLQSFPWQNSSEPTVVEISSENQNVELTAVTEMSHSPSSKCGWTTPDHKQLTSASLCYISATEMYLTWLVIKCLESDDIQALKTVEWCTHSIMKIDSSKSQGERVLFLPTTVQSEARIIKPNLPIPDHISKRQTTTTEPPIYVLMNYSPEIGGMNQAIIQWKNEQD